MAKKPAAHKKTAAKTSKGKKPAAKKAAKKPVGKKAAKAAAAPEAPSLGRPKVRGEELLFMLFHGDYEARQIFEFLRVETVKELEQHNPKEIFKRLTQPVANAVDRIRRGLAEKNRCLAGDEEYLLNYKAEQAKGS